MGRWALRAILAIAGLFVAAALVAPLVPLERQRGDLEAALSPGEDWTVSIASMNLSLWAGPATVIKGFGLYRKQPGGRVEVLNVERIRVEPSLWQALLGRPEFRLRIDGPRLLLAYGFSAEPPGTGEAAPGEAIERRILPQASWTAFRETARALLLLQERLEEHLQKEGLSGRPGRVQVYGAGGRIYLPPLADAGLVPLVLEGVDAFLLVPHPGEPGTISLQGNLQVGAERRAILAEGSIERVPASQSQASGFSFSNSLLHLGPVPVRLSLEVALGAGDSRQGTAASAFVTGQPLGRFHAEIDVAEGLESLGPLWTPLVSEPFPWKLMGGMHLSASSSSSDGQGTGNLEVRLDDLGILRGPFHKPPGMPGRFFLETAYNGERGRVIASRLELGAVHADFTGTYDRPDHQFLDLQFSGGGDLSGLRDLFPDLGFSAREASSLSFQGGARIARGERLLAGVAIRDLVLRSADSGLQASADLLWDQQLSGQVAVASAYFAPADLWTPARDSAAAMVLPLLRVPLASLRVLVALQGRKGAVGQMQAAWAGGDLEGRGQYVWENCLGRGGLVLDNVSLGEMAAQAGGAPAGAGIGEGRLSLKADVGRDLPCSKGLFGPLSAWGAHADVALSGLDLPISSGAEGTNLALLEKLSGASLRPPPRVRQGTGRLLWQGAQARLERFELDAGSAQVSLSGDLGGEEPGIRIAGSLAAPRLPGTPPPLLRGVVAEGSRVRLPLAVTGTWSEPKVALQLPEDDLRRVVLEASGAVPQAVVPIPR